MVQVLIVSKDILAFNYSTEQWVTKCSWLQHSTVTDSTMITWNTPGMGATSMFLTLQQCVYKTIDRHAHDTSRWIFTRFQWDSSYVISRINSTNNITLAIRFRRHLCLFYFISVQTELYNDLIFVINFVCNCTRNVHFVKFTI